LMKTKLIAFRVMCNRKLWWTRMFFMNVR
jgi:hypothetical protein